MKQIGNSIALLGLLLRLSYSAILAIAISHLISITLFFSGNDYLLSIPNDQLEAQVMFHAFFLFLPQIDNITTTVENVLTIPMAIGELSLGIWLLCKGGKPTKK